MFRNKYLLKTLRQSKKKYRRKYGKGKYSKNLGKFRRHNKYSPVLVREMGGFPERYYCKLKTTGAPLELPITGNSSFVSGIIPLNWFQNNNTLAPLGFQTLALIYDEFCVMGAELRMKIYNRTANPLKMVTVPIDNDDNLWGTPGGVAGYNQASSNPKSKERQINENGGGSNSIISHKHYVSIKNIAGQKVNSQNSELCGFTGSINSQEAFTNPVDLYSMFWQFNTFDDNSVISESGLVVTMECTYYVEFFSRLTTLRCTDDGKYPVGLAITDNTYVPDKKRYNH